MRTYFCFKSLSDADDDSPSLSHRKEDDERKGEKERQMIEKTPSDRVWRRNYRKSCTPYDAGKLLHSLP